MEQVKLKLTEKNDISFAVHISSDEPVNSQPKARLVCEGAQLSYVFNGKFEGGQVNINIPSLKGIMSEGSYKAKLELLIEDKYFEPLEFELVLVEPVKIQVEQKIIVNKEESKPKATIKEVNKIQYTTLKSKFKSS